MQQGGESAAGPLEGSRELPERPPGFAQMVPPRLGARGLEQRPTEGGESVLEPSPPYPRTASDLLGSVEYSASTLPTPHLATELYA